jgi:hypothetical protein
LECALPNIVAASLGAMVHGSVVIDGNLSKTITPGGAVPDFPKVMTVMESQRPGVTSPVGRIIGISVALLALGGFVTDSHDKPGAAEFSFGLLRGFDIPTVVTE